MTRTKTACFSVLAQLCAAICMAAHAQQAAPTPSTEDYAKFEQWRAFLQARNARDYAVTGENAIDEAKYVRLGGIEQWITIRGEDRGNPLLLFLHGGPGDVTNPWSYAIFRHWLAQFTVVQWDQRGAGRTLGRNGPAISATITTERMVKDGIELAELLRTELNKDKLILVGHSWGTVLGVLMVKARPDLFYAYVGTGQVADETKNYSVAYEALLRHARSVGEQRAIDELQSIGPPPYKDGQGYAVQRKWANLFEGADVFIAGMLGLGAAAPGYSVGDIDDWLQGQLLSSQQLVPEIAKLGPDELGGRFDVPFFVFQGAEDFTTPTELARRYVDAVKAPRKTFVAISGGGHFAVFMKPDEFLHDLVTRVRPLAIAR